MLLKIKIEIWQIIYKMNPYLIYKKNWVIIKINICQITHGKDGMRIISSGTFVLYYRIKDGFYKLMKMENRGIQILVI